MKVTRVNVDEKIIAGICIRTNNKKAKTDITKLWDEFYTNDIVNKITNRLKDSFIYGVYSDYKSDFNDDYTLTAGLEISRKDIKKHNTIIIKKGKYLLFENKGSLPNVVIDTWVYIWKYFEENKDIKRKYSSDFEVYKNNKDIQIYIAIK